MSRIYTMAERPTLIGKRRFETGDTTSRRRFTDRPLPLDTMTRHLVRDIIEAHQHSSPPSKSFLQKLLKTN